MPPSSEDRATNPRQFVQFVFALTLRLRCSDVSPDRIAEFGRAFHFRTPGAYFDDKEPRALAAELIDAYEFIERRPEKEIRVRIQHLGDAASLLQVNMEDQPFVLDSVLETARVLEIPIHNYLHPILQVARDDERKLATVRPRTAPGERESFLHVRIASLTDEEKENLENEVRQALVDAQRAVDDFSAMKQSVESVALELQSFPAADDVDHSDCQEAASLLRWLTLDNFVFLGYRAYDVLEKDGVECLQVREGSGLGILRDDRDSALTDPTPISEFSSTIRSRLKLRVFPLVTKTNRLSTVHRRASMEYVSIKQLNAAGEIVGEHRFLGLFTARALNEVCSVIPVLRRKLAAVLGEAEVIEGSHEYKQIVMAFNSMPKGELFGTAVLHIGQTIDQMLALQTENELRVSCQSDLLNHRASVMVILPRDRFNAACRARIQAALGELFGTAVSEFNLALSEETYARLHFYFQDITGIRSVPTQIELDRAVADAIRTWEDDFKDLVEMDLGSSHGRRVARAYGTAFGQGYRARVTPTIAVTDVVHFEALADGGVDVALHAEKGDECGTTTLRLYRLGDEYLLSEIMPILTNLGLLVIDESTFLVEGPDVTRRHLQTIRIQQRDGRPIATERYADLREAVLEILAGRYENDILGELINSAGLSVRQVDVVRAYVHLLRQVGPPHDDKSVVTAMSKHAALTAAAMRFFEEKFRPDRANSPAGDVAELTAQSAALQRDVTGQLEAITDLNEDRILRGVFNLVLATVRTNYFQQDGNKSQLALKVRSGGVPGMPTPVPLFEIFVHNTEMEGVHLRSGPVARGGIRWSDRRDDYRTEILGLMRTQVTKNAIIVPVGSKGGFILKQPPTERDALFAAVEEQYRTYIRGLLDVTDNRAGDTVVSPPDTVTYDAPDPYLVVAADKGTASFSDVGNKFAEEYGFWLGDAFASGGSNGYDHKKYGITARGAWECVRWLFFERGLDVDTEPFTVVGSGDVFGNGMLLSSQVKLVAAFDHRHIFIDPTPDPESSYEERKRLFETPRSTWEDYRPKCLSSGGGVFPRQAKSVPLSPEIRSLLGTDAESIRGEEIVRTILKLPVDLLYKGGIGTYVKASHETHADASDEKNDAVRVDAGELNCRIVGEGGNLGLTHAARVEFAARGGRINTDFIDNSGGVDLSDHEVNIKIALAPLVSDGTMELEARNSLLEEIAPEVCQLVLETNRDQARALSLEERASAIDPSDHLALLKDLRRGGLIEKTPAGFPDPEEIQRRREAGVGILRPELATLLAFAKIQICSSLSTSEIVSTQSFDSYLNDYFPDAVLERCGDRIQDHPLRSEIIATAVTNELVQRCGVTFIANLRRDHACDVTSAVRAYWVADRVVDGAGLFAGLDTLVSTGAAPPEAWATAVFEYRQAIGDLASWLVCNWPTGANEVPLSVDQIIGSVSRWSSPEAREDAGEGNATGCDGAPSIDRIVQTRADELTKTGLPRAFAARIAFLDIQRELPSIAALAEQASLALDRAALVFFLVRDALSLLTIFTALERLPVSGPSDRSAARALRNEVRLLNLRLTARVAPTCSGTNETCARDVGQFIYGRWSTLHAYLEVLEDWNRGSPPTLAEVIVIAERLRRLAG